MAYYRLGYSPEELRELWEKEADSLSEDRLRVLFGAPPYEFLEGETTDSVPVYGKLKDPLYVDSKNRCYYPLEGAEGGSLYAVKLPIREQRAESKRRNVAYGDGLDFPDPPERIVLFIAPGEAKRLKRNPTEPSSFIVGVKDVRQVSNRSGTAEIEFTSAVPGRKKLAARGAWPPSAEVRKKKIDQEQRRAEKREAETWY